MSQIHLLRGSQVKWSKDSVISGHWISADKRQYLCRVLYQYQYLCGDTSVRNVTQLVLGHMLAASIVLTIFASRELVGFYSRAWEGESCFPKLIRKEIIWAFQSHYL